jgi:hypothetical protein
MHVTLLAADLVPPPQFIAPPDLPRLASLEALLARGKTAKSAGMFLEEAVLGEFNVSPANAPVAALTRIADGGIADDATWLRADPVHLHVSRDNVQLMDSHVIEPTLAEANAIVATLNQHLAQDELSINVLDNARWYMKIPAGEAPRAPPLWQVAGGSVYDQLPQGDGRINWRRLQNELQMLLFDHPVNAAREAKGIVPINGIWLWGAGSLGHFSSIAKVDHVVGKLALVRGLAMHTSTALTPTLPSSFNDLTSDASSQLVILHKATRALRANQRYDYVESINQLERDWFMPALAALDVGKIEKLALLLPNETASLRVDVLPKTRGLFSIFSVAPKIKPLHTYFS